MSPLSKVFLIVIFLLTILSFVLSFKAESARQQFICSNLAIHEFKHGSLEKAYVYLEGANKAYFTGNCDPKPKRTMSIEVVGR